MNTGDYIMAQLHPSRDENGIMKIYIKILQISKIQPAYVLCESGEVVPKYRIKKIYAGEGVTNYDGFDEQKIVREERNVWTQTDNEIGEIHV